MSMLTLAPNTTQQDLNGAFAVLALFPDDNACKKRALELKAILDQANERIARADEAEKSLASRNAELARDTIAANKTLDQRRNELDNIEAEQIKRDAALKKRKEALDAGRAELERGQKALEADRSRFIAESTNNKAALDKRQEAVAAAEAQIAGAREAAAQAQAKADGLIATYNAKIAALNQAMGAKASA